VEEKGIPKVRVLKSSNPLVSRRMHGNRLESLEDKALRDLHGRKSDLFRRPKGQINLYHWIWEGHMVEIRSL
jgi:hypothetical protein